MISKQLARLRFRSSHLECGLDSQQSASGWFSHSRASTTPPIPTPAVSKLSSRYLHQPEKRNRLLLSIWVVSYPKSVGHTLWDTLQPEKSLLEAIKTEDHARFFALIKQGVNGAVQSEYNLPALHQAAMLNRDAFIVPLLQHGAKIDSKTDSGATALHCAALFGHTATLKILLENHASTEIADENGWTPLMSAAAGDQPAAAALLLAHGASILALDNAGSTPLHHAAQRDASTAMITALLDAGVAVDVRDKNWGKTALHYAAADGWVSIVEALLNRGADPNVKDGNYRIPRQCIGSGKGGSSCTEENGKRCTAMLLEFEEKARLDSPKE